MATPCHTPMHSYPDMSLHPSPPPPPSLLPHLTGIKCMSPAKKHQSQLSLNHKQEEEQQEQQEQEQRSFITGKLSGTFCVTLGEIHVQEDNVKNHITNQW
jgi:hypothetical protein